MSLYLKKVFFIQMTVFNSVMYVLLKSIAVKHLTLKISTMIY